jgi:hypothetical protein
MVWMRRRFGMMGAISTVPDFSGEQYEISPPIVIPFPRDESRAGDDKLTLWFGCGAGLERWGQYRLFQIFRASDMKLFPLIVIPCERNEVSPPTVLPG